MPQSDPPTPRTTNNAQNMPKPPTYTFGDSDLAARRLALVAETFADMSAAFMRESVRTRPQLAADLGCGPGYTTHLLADTLKPERTVGLDNSENFLANVRTSASGNVSFHLHDITTAPFPEAPFDLIFSRLVLTHLQDPETAITLWTEQLRPKGLLLLEEVESIYTKVPALVTYLDIQQAMLAQQSNELYIGPRLDALTASHKLHRRSSKVRTLQVPAARAAAMFHMNLGVWRHNDFVQQTYAPTTLDALDQDLQTIAQGHTDDPSVEWHLRQIVIEQV